MNTLSDNDSNRDIKIESIKASIKDSALDICRNYYICNNHEDVSSDFRLENGLPDPIWLNNGFGDQVSESLNDIDDWLELDPKLFPPFKDRNEAWDIIDQYLEYSDVEEIIFNVWDDYLSNIYGKEWYK